MTEEIKELGEELVDNPEREMDVDGSILSAETQDDSGYPQDLQSSDLPSK